MQPASSGFGRIEYPKPDEEPEGSGIRPYHPGTTTRGIRDARPPSDRPQPPTPSRPTRRRLLAGVAVAVLAGGVAVTRGDDPHATAPDPDILVCASRLSYSVEDTSHREGFPDRVISPSAEGDVWSGPLLREPSAIAQCERNLREGGFPSLADPVAVYFGMNFAVMDTTFVIPRSQLPAGTWSPLTLTVLEPGR